MATGSVGPEVSYAPGGDAKAFLSNAKPAPTLAVSDASRGGGVGSGGIAATLQQVQEQLSPLSYSSDRQRDGGPDHRQRLPHGRRPCVSLASQA
ncbi:hypothetical protein [Rhizobium grahamii]|uniref:hypothetical protein n=1 Tax=Rhizobium grahamii TaxID=1120045 RepID=UPI0002D6C156|nr:hypothetical protein [Rhizobium grahamii]